MVTFTQQSRQILKNEIAFSSMVDAEGIEFLIEDGGTTPELAAQVNLMVAKDADPSGAVMVTAKTYNSIGVLIGECSHQFDPSILDCSLWSPAVSIDVVDLPNGEIDLVEVDTDFNVIRVLVDSLELSIG